jgi:hypothetical protein
MPPTAPDQPDFFTVEEAARVLRIGRTAAYELARVWRETDGREGLPVVAFGRLLRVPRAALETISGSSITVAIAPALPATPARKPESVNLPPPAPRVEQVRTTRRSHRRNRTAVTLPRFAVADFLVGDLESGVMVHSTRTPRAAAYRATVESLVSAPDSKRVIWP